MSRHARLGCLAILLLTACNPGSDDPIYIGLAGAFDDEVGHPMTLGAQLAVEEINAAGGVNGRPIALLERNDYGNPDSAVMVAIDLYASAAVAVVGHLYSGTTLAASPVYNSGATPIVAISPSSSAPDVSEMGPYTFRVCPSDEQHGETLAAWIRERLGLRYGSVFYLNDGYGRGVRQRFTAEFVRRGGVLGAVAPYLGGTPEVDALMDRLAQDTAAQFIVVAGNLSEAEEILRQARARGVTLPLLGADGLEGIEGSGPIAEGVYETLAYLPQLDRPGNREFVASYTEHFPDEPPPNQPAAASYDAIHLLKRVMLAHGTEREAIREGLEAVTVEEPYEGVTGQIAFDGNGDVPTREVYVAVVRNGALRLAGGQ